MNYGELLAAGPVQEITGTLSDGTVFRLSDYRGHWIFLSADSTACDETCERKLYATRQARTIQGREQERVVRLWLEKTDAPAAPVELLAQHPGLVVARIDAVQWTALRRAFDPPRDIYIVDPLGNVVLRYPENPDIKRMAKDLERLLKASRIG